MNTKRKLMRSRFREYFSYIDFDGGVRSADDIAAAIEEGCFAVVDAKSPHFDARYSEVCYRVINEIDIGSDLHERLASGEIRGDELGGMSSEQLNPAAGAAIRDEIEHRSKQKINIKVSTAYKCKSCGGNRTSVIDYQSTAADEGSTLSIKCLNDACRHVWRVR